MRLQNIIILLLFTEKLFGQHGGCGDEYPNGFYHNSQFITAQGDTLNKLNSSKLYEGLHLYTDNSYNLFRDTNSFIIGYFQNGLPIGEWKDHCKDGTYSIGQFRNSTENTTDEKGNWIKKQQGIYVKIGVWKYFDKNGNLLLTKNYDRKVFKNGWADQTLKADSLGNFILIKFESKFNYSNWKRKIITKLYTDTGEPLTAEYKSFWKNVSYEYYPNGKVKKETRGKKFLGIYLKTTIEKEYNSKGQVKCKTRTKCKHLDTTASHHDSF